MKMWISQANGCRSSLSSTGTVRVANLAKALSLLFMPLYLFSCSADSDSPEKPEKSSSIRDERVVPFLGDIGDGKYKPKHGKKVLSTFEDYLAAAKDALRQNAYVEAGEYAKQALRLNDKSGQAHYIRGKGLSASAYGDDEEALLEFKKAIALGFKSADLFEFMAKVYDGKKDYPYAIDALTNAIRLTPTDLDLYRARGGLYALVGNIDAAEKDYAVQIEMAHDRKSKSYMSRGRFYEGQGLYEKALSDFSLAVKDQTRDTDELRARVRMLLQLERRKEALKDLFEIIERNPADDDSIRERGNLYAELGDNEKALADYNLAIEHSPDLDRPSYEARAKIYEKLGKNDLAQKDRARARAISDRPAEKPMYDSKP
ncbi:MAG: tetratricopeptide repeat protein [Candidatus Obscuribacterales bacterium]|nr:tetratricopeptide repeat protein [Candidatus Obscuribacterales bacterium]